MNIIKATLTTSTIALAAMQTACVADQSAQIGNATGSQLVGSQANPYTDMRNKAIVGAVNAGLTTALSPNASITAVKNSAIQGAVSTVLPQQPAASAYAPAANNTAQNVATAVALSQLAGTNNAVQSVLQNAQNNPQLQQTLINGAVTQLLSAPQNK